MNKNLISRIKNQIYKFVNLLVIKHENWIFTSCLENAQTDHYDILNYSSSNMLTTLHAFCNEYHQNKYLIFIEYFDEDRLPAYLEFASKVKLNNVDLRFYKSYKNEPFLNNIKIRVRGELNRFRSKYWLNESGGTRFPGQLRCQQIVCFGYFISCKEDYTIGNERRWEAINYLCTTALLPSQIISASTGVLLGNCRITGFPRNDTLVKSNKADKIKLWIKDELGYVPQYIICYAPTYRDYEKVCTDNNRPLFGYTTPGLNELLKTENVAIICKLHPYQNILAIANDENVLFYKNSYDFSFYDVLSIADALICDYSSISFDYLLLNRPIIYNLYDFDKYMSVRGLSYDPYQQFCPGEIVTSWNELKDAIIDAIHNPQRYRDDRELITNLIYKYKDFESTNRVLRMLKSVLSDDEFSIRL